MRGIPRPAVFLDRDGVIVRDVDLLVRSDQIELLPGVAGALRRLREARLPVVIVTNQPAVARGLLTEPELAAAEVYLAASQQELAVQAMSEEAEHEAWTSYARVLLAANEFVYVD